MARALVVGGNGFLGSHIVDELVQRGHDVTVFDRFSSPVQNWSAVGVSQIKGDFLDTAALNEAVAGQDLLFHFLSTTTPATAEADPELDVRTNIAQSVELFSLAAEAGVSRVFFASTGGAMYGDGPQERLNELSLPAPVSPYAIGKQAIEGYLRYFARTRGLASTSFRISNPYGPRQHPNKKQGVIPIFLQRVAQGLPVPLFGDGTDIRDYVYAEDAARLIVATVDAEPRHPVYNIGSGEGVSLVEVVQLIGEVTGRPVQLETRPHPATFVRRVVLDTRRYSDEFGVPKLVELRDGIERTWHATLGSRL